MSAITATRFKSFGDDYLTRSLLACAFISAAVFVGLLGPFLVEDRLVDGHNVWLKPQKFTVSLFVHFMTVAIAAQLLTETIRSQRILAISVGATMVAHVFEGLWVIYQAGRSRRSHFNYDSNLESLMYAGMGIAVLFLVWGVCHWSYGRHIGNACSGGIHVHERLATGRRSSGGRRRGSVLWLVPRCRGLPPCPFCGASHDAEPADNWLGCRSSKVERQTRSLNRGSDTSSSGHCLIYSSAYGSSYLARLVTHLKRQL